MRLDERYLTEPHETWQRLRVEAPVAPVVMPRGLRVWLVTRHADVRSALADPRLAKDAKRLSEVFARQRTDDDGDGDGADALGAHMLDSDPPDHERLRRLVNKAFTGRRIAELRPRIDEIATGLLDDIGPSGEVDLLDAYAFPLPITVICELLGVPTEGRDDFRRWTTLLLTGGDYDEAMAAQSDMARTLVDLVASKRAEPADDMLSALVRARDADDRLSEVELTSMAFLLLVAGHETTVNLIGNGVLALIQNPDQQAALRADMSLLPNAIEELLRYQGPLRHATFRFTAEPVELGGVTVPEGELVMLSLASANRDEARFADPDRLDLRRDPTGHLAFGHGIHYCVGAPLARSEAEIAFRRLLERYRRIELVGEVRWRPGNLIRGLERLPVRLG
jgi:cytochrome P450